jgi:hypothetical protein
MKKARALNITLGLPFLYIKEALFYIDNVGTQKHFKVEPRGYHNKSK